MNRISKRRANNFVVAVVILLLAPTLNANAQQTGWSGSSSTSSRYQPLKPQQDFPALQPPGQVEQIQQLEFEPEVTPLPKTDEAVKAQVQDQVKNKVQNDIKREIESALESNEEEIDLDNLAKKIADLQESKLDEKELKKLNEKIEELEESQLGEKELEELTETIEELEKANKKKEEELEELAETIEELEESALDEDDLPAFTAGYDGGFRIKPRDKKKTPFDLKINGRLQFRWAAFQRDSSFFTNRLGTVEVPSRNDFEIERGRLELKGFVLDEKLKYYFNLDADTDDNHGVIFHDFWFDYDLRDNLTVRLGKAKVAGSYEWLESSTTTRFSDRSLSTTYFRADRSVGVWLLGNTPNNFNYQVSVTNGFFSTDLEPEDVDNNFAYTGIYYWDPWGDVGKGYSDLKFHLDPVIRIGNSFSYTNTNPLDNGSPTREQNFARVSDGARLTDTGALAPGLTVNDFDQFLVSSFISGKYRGFSFNAEYYARWLQNFGTIEGPSTGINELFDSGFYIDVGYFLVPGKFEVNGRVSQIDGLFGDTWEYAAGWNWFHDESHKSKVTFDATVLEGNPTSSSSPNFEIGQDGILYRLQYQIAF